MGKQVAGMVLGERLVGFVLEAANFVIGDHAGIAAPALAGASECHVYGGEPADFAPAAPLRSRA